ncbi:hypothetical protein LEL_05372 [Akanthomyces lecanii RCEF 1005]|uniref:Uncharacterized protein n=1 Tax=Akanthomyces lecanii RCEF 1005 TaxID=1081108 RepID=A0A168I084_CORDF|nr:hypothetical protein LEL_05372 [Akanthomyces lecanii RCEF 1005]
MTALGLSRFQAIEPASYNPNLAASTWKFDLCAWKSMEEQLRFQGRWFVLKNTMQEDTEAAKQMHDDPEEPLPDLANVQVEPTIFEDPAAFEPMEQPAQSTSQPHVGPVQWPQDSESMEWSSGSYLTGTTPTNDSGTSSGLGYSDSAQSRSNPSTFHDNSHTGSSSGSSVPRPLEASGPFNVGDGQASPSTQEEKTLVWQGAAAMKALRDEEAARAMPPPDLPRRLTLPLQQSSSSSSSSTADYPVNASGSMEIYSQASTSYDPKGKRPASSSWIGQPGPSTEAARPAQMPYDYDEEQSVSDSWPTSETWPDSDPWPNADPWLTSEPWPNSTDPGMDEASASQAVVPYDRKGKRRAFEPRPNPTDAGMDEALQAAAPYDHKGKRRAFEPWSNPTDAGMEEASQAVVPYDRKGKRPASVSWDTQPKRPSPLHQSLTSEGTVTANSSVTCDMARIPIVIRKWGLSRTQPLSPTESFTVIFRGGWHTKRVSVLGSKRRSKAAIRGQYWAGNSQSTVNPSRRGSTAEYSADFF